MRAREKKKKKIKKTDCSKQRKSKSEHGRSSDSNRESDSGLDGQAQLLDKQEPPSKSESHDDSEVEVVMPNGGNRLHAHVEKHIGVMQEGQANLEGRTDELEKKVEYYEDLSENRLVDIDRWVDGSMGLETVLHELHQLRRAPKSNVS
ncbi:hypothetical protein FRC11_013760 [Ceratobasidium sp. 423]|nr:hypothetical protein FRC11_013760 [Ceratobasidium sp. 423]